MTARVAKKKKPFRYCKVTLTHHLPTRLQLRGKADSYYLECGACGESELVATWYETIKEFGLDKIETWQLHDAFQKLWHAQLYAIEQHDKKVVQKRKKS